MTDITVYAEDSMQLKQANKQIVEVLREKKANARKAAEESHDAIKAAEHAGFSVRALKAAAQRQHRLEAYYDKLITAVDAGYTIIPSNFFAEVIALRTDAKRPPRKGLMPTKALPAGEGRYVNKRPFNEYYVVSDSKGGEITKYRNTDIDEDVEFPMFAAKPRLITMAHAAMKPRLFDEIRVAGGPSSDPMLIGTIRHANRPYESIWFLIGWWLDTSTL